MNTIVDAQSVDKRTTVRFQPLVSLTTLQLLRVTTQHVPASGRCAECGFAVSGKTPLCPAAAVALRELAKRGVQRPAPTRNLAKQSTLDLLKMAAAHHPTSSGRCARCGFTYTANVQDCPKLRLIRNALEARGTIPITQLDKNLGMCVGKAEAWDLAGQDAAAWGRAIDACHQCPLLVQCHKQTKQSHVANVIAGGIAYDEDGHPIDRKVFHRHIALSSASSYIRTSRSDREVAA